MTDLAAWIAEKRKASVNATPGLWQRSGVRIKMDGDQWHTVGAVGGGWFAAVIFVDKKPGDLARSIGDANHIAAFDPQTTRKLLDAVEALDAMLLDVQDYPAWERPCAAVDRAKAALDALRGG